MKDFLHKLSFCAGIKLTARFMAASFKDYYQTLGVPRSASADEIKSAFRKPSRASHHPDVAKDKKAGEIKFKEINEAHEVLGDPEKRKKYDELGQHWDAHGAPPPGYEYAPGAGGFAGGLDFHFEGTGFSDFFEQIVGGGRASGFPGGGFSSGGFPAGAHARADRCPVRISKAIFPSRSRMRCRVRSGKSRSNRSIRRPGQAPHRTFKVRIPKGALEGQVIRVPGKGGAGTGGGAAGNLLLRVRLARHPDFRPAGADLYYDLPLAPWEAVLGTTVRVHGLDGELDVKIPAGTNNGQRLRLRGRGLPKPKSTERGDLYVVAEVELPKQITPEEKKLWEQLGRSSSFHPRE